MLAELKQHKHEAFIGSIITLGIGAALVLLRSADRPLGMGAIIVAVGLVAFFVLVDYKNHSHSFVAIYAGLIMGGGVAALASFADAPALYRAVFATALTTGILLVIRKLHFPVLIYTFGFAFEGFGVSGFLLSVPLFVVFLVVISVGMFAMKTGLFKEEAMFALPRPKTIHERIEYLVHKIIPYALILLVVITVGDIVYTEELDPYHNYLVAFDGIIIFIFILDLYFKWQHAPKLVAFLRENWLDIIAVMPFFVLFRMLKGASAFLRILRVRFLARNIKPLSRMAKYAARSPHMAAFLDHFESHGKTKVLGSEASK